MRHLIKIIAMLSLILFSSGWSPATLGGNGLTSQIVDPNPPPVNPYYDISHIEAEMVLVFDDNGIERPTWPSAPNFDETPCMVTAGITNSLLFCLNQGGKHIIVPAGTYSLPQQGFQIRNDDQWLDMDDNTTLVGGMHVHDANRIKITGGNITRGEMVITNVDDFVMDNVNLWLEAPGGPVGTGPLGAGKRRGFLLCQQFGTNPTNCNRVAIINTTCISNLTCALNSATMPGQGPGTYGVNSLIFANYSAWSRFDNGVTAPLPEFVSRLQGTNRVLIVDSHYRTASKQRASGVGTPISINDEKPAQRFHYGGIATLLTTSKLETVGTFTSIYVDTTANAAEHIDSFDIDNLFVMGNEIHSYADAFGVPRKTSDISIDDSVPVGGTTIPQPDDRFGNPVPDIFYPNVNQITLVHLENNEAFHPVRSGFRVVGNWNGTGGQANCGGRDPCLRNINNTGVIVPGLELGDDRNGDPFGFSVALDGSPWSGSAHVHPGL